MNNLKSLFLKLIPFMILSYAGWSLYLEYEEYSTKKVEKISQKQGLESKMKMSKRRLKKIVTFKANLKIWKKKITLLNSKIEKVQKQLPSNINDTEVISYIKKEAELVNIKQSELSPSKENVNGFYIGKEYKFNGVGTYLQFIIMFERLQMSDRLFNVKKMSIKNEGVLQKGRFSLVKCETTLESFKYNSSYQQRSGIEDIENKYKTN
jgi:Tfp pilus assembly protein PilO